MIFYKINFLDFWICHGTTILKIFKTIQEVPLWLVAIEINEFS